MSETPTGGQASGRETALEGRLRQLERQVGGFNGALDEQASVLEDLAKLLQANSDQKQGNPKRKVNGRTGYRSDPAEVEAYLNELHPWVHWLNEAGISVAHSGGETVPECWPHHAGVVEELLALHGAWAAAYLGEPDSDSMIAFHDRWLGPCLQRIMGSYRLHSCRDKGACQAQTPPADVVAHRNR